MKLQHIKVLLFPILIHLFPFPLLLNLIFALIFLTDEKIIKMIFAKIFILI